MALSLYITMNKKDEVFESKAPICPYCGTKTYLTSFRYMRVKNRTKNANKARNRLIYMCPNCHKYVNVHKGTNIPMGYPGDKELRLWRRYTHMVFDDLWHKSGNRKKAYTWLSRVLGLETDECHIGMFNSEQCKLAIEVCIKELARVPSK